LSKHKTFAAHFSLFSGTPVCRGAQFGKHCHRPSTRNKSSNSNLLQCKNAPIPSWQVCSRR